MIFGAHVIASSQDASADRAFFRDVLGYPSVDAGHDWLIFALLPAEVAVHPADAVGTRCISCATTSVPRCQLWPRGECGARRWRKPVGAR